MALWGGRFSQGPEESLAALSRSVHFDWRLAKYDVKVNLIHLNGLVKSGVITPGNGEVIKAGLKALASDIEKGSFTYNASDEDVHSAIERGLIEKIGNVGGSIRAGRSRNDLVVTDFKLYLIDHLIEVADLLSKLVKSFNEKSTECIGIYAPGFTHLQHAQPILFSHELAKHSHSLLRDLSRISDWLERNSSSPFGAGALAGSPLQLDPEKAAELLGFDSVIANSIDAVSDRDFVVEALFILATVGVHLSRIGEEFTLWNSSEFDWVTLDDKFSTGSSIMPQKKNPDIAELARGKAGRLIGNLISLLTTMKGLPFAYNRDLQEDKEPVFDSIETLLVLLPALIGMIETSKFHREKIESGALSGFALATEVADFLAQNGVPFSEAHEISGKAVKFCENNGIEFHQLTEVQLLEIDNRLTGALLSKLNLTGAVNSRSSSLGTAERSVKEQLKNLSTDVTEADILDIQRPQRVFGHDVPVTSKLIEDLEWRGLIAQTTDLESLIKDLNAGPVTFYVGFDPTAPSLHVGNLVIILAMRRFQLAGHNPIALVGGATGLVGDPSGRNEERALNDESIVDEWVSRIKSQLQSFLIFEGKNKAIMANNLDWTKPYSALQFLRDIGKHFSVNQMLSKDSVSSRLEAGGISYTEFSYQVLQALDYLELYKKYNCTLQLGGSDQWGNIVAGLDLIRKIGSGTGHAFTIPLMAKTDGSKFGKTASGAVWLDPAMTSPYAFYQFWINSDDADVIKFLKTFSFKSREELEPLFEIHNENPGKRQAHRELARELTSLVHGQKTAENVEAASLALFGQGNLNDIDEETLAAALSQLPRAEISKKEEFPTWVDLINEIGVVKSKSDARRVIKDGGAYLNNEKISSEDFRPRESDLIHGRFLVLRKGKRDLAAVEVR